MNGLQSRAPVAPALRRSLGTAAAAADELLERRKPELTRRLSRAERRAETVLAAVFVVGASLLVAVFPAHAAHGTSVALLVLAYAVVRRVRFQFGTGLIRPTQLVFVPMLFLTPASWVPALVAAGSVLGELPDVVLRRAHRERLLVCLADGWYSFGPALVVIGLGPAVGTRTAVAALVCALVAQFASDLAASSLREWFGARVRPRELWPVLALVYVVDALLTPLGYLAVLAGLSYEYAYLLAIAPAAVLGLLAGERSGRITRELELERAFRRSARALDARTQELRRRAERLQGGDRRMGEAVRPPVEPARLEPLLLSTVMDVVRADCGRLRPPAGHASQPPVVISRIGELQEALDRAERTVGRVTGPALAVRLSSGHVLAVARAGAAFSALDRELVEQLGAHAALALENQRLHELMYQADEELRGILEGVAEAVMVEDASGQILYRNPAADALLPNLTDLATTLGVPATALPGWRLFNGEAPRPFVVRHPDRRRWSRVKSAAIPPHGPPRLAVSAIEDISDIKRAEEAQRFLAESSRVLATSLDLDDTLPRLERLAAGWMGGHWRITVRATPADPPPGEALHVPIRVRGGVAGEITLSDMQVGPLETAIAEDLGLRVGAAVDLFRVYRSRAVIAQTLQASLLPAVPPEIAGLETAGLYRPAGTRSDVSGDFYDVFSTGPDTWYLVSGDVRGRGAEAAALSNLARHTVREAAAGDRSPAEILRRVNEVFLGRREGAFLGVACGRLDLQMDPAAVTVACGGHPAPRVLRASGVVEAFGSEGTLLGVLAAVEVDDRVTALHRGDALIFYTDGLLKAEAPAAWDTEQLHTIVAAAVGQTAQGIVEHLAATVEGPLRDDLALLAVRVKPAP